MRILLRRVFAVVLALGVIAPALLLGTTTYAQEKVTCDTIDHDLAQMLLDTNKTGDFVTDYDPDGNGIACDHDGPNQADGQFGANIPHEPQTEQISAQASASSTCADFDAWEWAQSVFESDPQKYDALDPDGDGTACPELPHGGFAPAFWTDLIPEDAQEVQIIRTIDGDTFEMRINGVSNRVRIYRADTPETQNKHECGGPEATAFADFALGFNDTPGTVYLEKDKTSKDRYGRELAYVWFEIDGKPYMLNHILINNGYAADKDYGDRKYDAQFKQSAAFAKRHDLGVWSQCGGFGVPEQVPPTAAPQPVQPPASQPEAPAAGAGCDPNYVPCIPAYPPDLNCPDIGIKVQVIGSDPHGLDRDKDGWGCESYG